MTENLQRARDFLLGKPLPESDTNTATEWVRLSEWSDAQELVTLVLVVLVLLVTLWNLRRVAGYGRRLVLFSLRGAVVAVLLFMFYQPALLEETSAKSTNTVILLADDSASMSLPHGEGTRRDLVASFIREHSQLWSSMENTNILESYRFSDVLEPTDWRDMAQGLVAKGQHTHLIEVLEELRDRYRNRDVGAILLMSDGIDNGRIGRILRTGNELDYETRRVLQSFDAPIHTFTVDRSEIRDVSVYELRYSPFAFKRNQSTIEAEIRVQGYETGLLEVDLLEEGRVLRSVSRELSSSESVYTVSFDFTPMELGHRVYSVRVRAFPEEVTLENNERYGVIRVNRDKIRVLQIAGHPSWDVRFLRNHLKRTPNVQLISFFILINTGATLRPVSSRETSLIPFPAQELFVEELGGFDLVIFQDFNYGPFSTRQHLHRVRDYVREGGGMVLVGGRLSFGAGGYVGTELAEVLPIEMTDVSHDEDALDTEEFSPQLTSAGRSHTVTRLSFDPIENERLWETAPSLEGVNKSRGIVQGGVSLLEHPTLRMDDGSPMPVLALSEPGDGRVAAITTDTFWRLKMPAVGQGADGHQYDTFWRNLIRWLIKDPELDLVRVTPSEGVRALGESVTMDVRVFTPDYRPATDHDFSIQIVRRPRPGHETAPETIYESVGLRTDDHGRQSITHDPVEAGIYDVIVRTVVGGRQLTALSVFVIADERPEMRNVMGEGPLMGAIARLTNGQERSLRTRSSAFPLNPPRVSQVISRRYHERWNVPGVFALICLLFTLEWWYRRRAGLI